MWPVGCAACPCGSLRAPEVVLPKKNPNPTAFHVLGSVYIPLQNPKPTKPIWSSCTAPSTSVAADPRRHQRRQVLLVPDRQVRYPRLLSRSLSQLIFSRLIDLPCLTCLLLLHPYSTRQPSRRWSNRARGKFSRDAMAA